jgi:uncharacterized protein (DUF2147 family)
MKQLAAQMAAFAAVTLCAISAMPAAAQSPSIVGLWATGNEGGKVEIFRCGSAYCGKIVDATRLRTDPNLRDVRNRDGNLRARKLKNLVVLSGFQGGPTHFRGGPLYDPESGQGAKRGELRLLPSGKLEVKGCVAVFCSTKIWSRIS